MSRFLKILLVTIIIGSTVKKVHAQQKDSSVFGTVLDHKKQPITDISIVIKDTNKGAYSSKNGTFTINKISPGTYTLIVSGIGFKEIRKEILVASGQNLSLVLTLEEDLTTMDEVLIKGKSVTSKVEEKSFTINSIETENFKNNTTDVNQILNQTSGIRVRESGGLGASYEFS